MTKAKITSHPATEVVKPRIDATATVSKAKPQRAKAAPADEGCATAITAVAPTKTSTTLAIPAATPKPPRQTKAALLRARLAEPGGISLAALIDATGWQSHTLRAYLSGLRKDGMSLTRRREGGRERSGAAGTAAQIGGQPLRTCPGGLTLHPRPVALSSDQSGLHRADPAQGSDLSRQASGDHRVRPLGPGAGQVDLCRSPATRAQPHRH